MAARHIAHVTLVVRDYEEVRRWYCEKLGFHVVEDTPLNEDKRWVAIALGDSRGTSLVLGKTSSEDQLNRIGDPNRGSGVSLPRDG